MKKNYVLLMLIFITQLVLAQQRNYQKLSEGYLYKKYPKLSKNEDITWKITDQVYSKHNKLTHVYVRPVYAGFEIANWNLNLTIYNNKVLRVVGKTLTDVSGNMIQATQHNISANDAINQVIEHYNLGKLQNLTLTQSPIGKSQKQIFDKSNIAVEDIPAELMYFEKDKKLYLVWDIAIYPLDKKHWWNVKVNALNGEILDEVDWVSECNFGTENHTHSASCINTKNHFTPSLTDNAQYNVYAYPVESPNHGNRSMVVNPADVTASPHGWHDTDNITGPEYTITRGNNVHAYEDRNNNNAPGFSPDGGSSLIFDFPIDFTQDPSNYQSAVITNLFYWNNLIHDIYYYYGFDEQSGNFQENNYGNGGSGGDYVRAEALDGSGTNNANFATPPDGSNGRMQMYVWNGTSRPLTINSPAGIAGLYQASGANFGPGLPSVPVTSNIVIADDGSANPSRACNTLINGSAITGNIALIDRGDCAFVDKVLNAQNAGAVAVIIVNNEESTFTMGGSGTGITIPSIMVTQSVGNLIRDELNNSVTVNASIQDAPIVNITSDLDNGVIIHEYGHGISIRLTGGPSNSGCLSNQEQMGEGWSDYFALVTTMNVGDIGATPRGIGTYVVNEPVTGGGIRPAPYTTDMSINPYTYGNIDNPEISVPHGVGFIWCSMLWDMTWLFIDRYGFDPDMYNGTGGNNIALQLVMDGLKLQPCNPGFEDGRDAILLADQINNNGANQDIIWEAFARRGMGFSASQGSSNSRTDGNEAFDIPPPISVEKSVNTLIAEANEILEYEITIKNIYPNTITGVNLIDNLADEVSYINNSVSTGGEYISDLHRISFSNLSLSANEESTHSFQVRVTEPTLDAEIRFFDNHDEENTNWQLGGDVMQWVRVDTDKYSGTHSLFATNLPFKSTQDLTMNNPISIHSNTHLIFIHKYNSEAEYDGGVVEISTDNGTTWDDLGSFMIENGYSMEINASTDSDLAGRNAFAGNSNGFIRTSINLSSFSGENVLIRFVFATDAFVGADGWYIDDIYFANGFQVADNIAVATYQGESFLSNAVSVALLGQSLFTGLENALKSNKINIYPNPTTDILNIDIREATNTPIKIKILDTQGREVISNKYSNSEKLLQFDVKNIERGLYFIHIELNGHNYIAKIVLQ